ncbi:hypothetical protein K503DRAFT_260185 [Rhizopogon vinicolor AM-OR11-026]|uniref:Uncharacterized protein n=1 Tax=Rhizopogon vinicolor AM-OR11-026 TaxID=1314800 RepID=A0A1B7MWP1_9AGAM|nr:hypothetical protein K503DRAFT_260185 [Rhizopogon vinicolor AM-OR11-026]
MSGVSTRTTASCSGWLAFTRDTIPRRAMRIGERDKHLSCVSGSSAQRLPLCFRVHKHSLRQSALSCLIYLLCLLTLTSPSSCATITHVECQSKVCGILLTFSSFLPLPTQLTGYHLLDSSEYVENDVPISYSPRFKPMHVFRMCEPCMTFGEGLLLASDSKYSPRTIFMSCVHHSTKIKIRQREET